MFQAGYTNKENLISWMLTFGSSAVLLKPEDIREELRKIAEAMAESYRS